MVKSTDFGPHRNDSGELSTVGQSQAVRLLRGYLADGDEFFQQIHGKFVAAIWDPRAAEADDCQ